MRQSRNRKGSYLVMVAVMLTVLLGFSALSVDISYLRLARIQAQNAADAGAHAALLELRSSGDIDAASELAETIINMNTIAGDLALVDTSEDIIFGGWDFEAQEFDDGADYINAVAVTVRRDEDSPGGPVELFLAPILGIDNASANSTALSVGALRFREIIIAQDITGSFAGEIDDARDANLIFLDYLYENQFPYDMIGMVTFAGAGEVWTELDYVEDTYSDTYSTWETLDWCSSKSGGVYQRTQMMRCDTTGTYLSGGTSQGDGIASAVDELLDKGNDEAVKVIVLVSDGQPYCRRSWCTAARTTFGTDMADYADENDISVYPVSFNDSYNVTQSAYMESLERGYGEGMFKETPDEEELSELLWDIAAAIPVALVQ